MSIDTPATIAILGTGPIGLEAAIYARFMGYKVDLYESGQIAENVLRWGHVRMFSPFGMNRSTLGMAAIQAQNPSWQPPDDEDLLTGREWADGYLLPLAATDLIKSNIQTETRVLGVSRKDQLKTELVGDEDRDETPLLLLVEDKDGQRYAEADVVVDTTGTFGQPNKLGSGGLPAVGEREAAAAIRYDLPDVLGEDREQYADRHTLVVGAGYSAATSVVALKQLAEESPNTKVTWLVRGDRTAAEPIARIADDSLSQRDQLAQDAAAALAQPDSKISFQPGSIIDSISAAAADTATADATGPLTVTIRDASEGSEEESEIVCDQIIANVGYHGDNSLYAQLQVHECFATGGPMKLAAALAGDTSADCLKQSAAGVDALVTSEPNFYILGSKSYGRDNRFLVSIGLEQIRELFGLIGGRATLNLYADVQGLLSQ